MAHSNGINPERDTANARLIAAAPDLLEAAIEALRLIIDAHELGKVPTNAECLLRVAISKATYDATGGGK